MAIFNFNAQDVAPDAGFDPLPKGEYKAVISTTEILDNKAGTGKYLKAKYEIVDGKHKGRIIFDNQNIQHTNETAQRIGQAHLSAMCRACGVMNLRQTEELHNKPIKITLDIKPPANGYDATNVIKKWESLGNATYTSTTQTAPPPAKAAQTENNEEQGQSEDVYW